MARFIGKVTEQQLRECLTKLTIKYPLMSAHITQNDDGSAYFTLNDHPQYLITVTDRKSDSQWLDVAIEEQKKPFAIDKGPLIRFTLLNSTQNSDLVILCQHTICDGLSLTFLVKDLIKLLSNLNKTLSPQPLPPAVTEDNFSVDVATGVLPKLLLKYMNWSWKKHKVTFNQTDYEQIHRSYWDSNKVKIKLLTLPQELTASLISRCHQEKVSVNSAVVTAFMFAQNDLQGSKPNFSEKVGVAVNIRKLFKEPADEAFGLLAAGNLIPVVRKYREGFWVVAKKANLQTKKLLANPQKALKLLAFNHIDPTLIDSMWFTAYGGFQNKTALQLKKMFLNPTEKPKRKIGVTNLGKVAIGNSEQPYKFKDLFFVPPYWSTYEKIIGIVTAAGIMNISILYDTRYIADDIMEQFRLLTLKYIEEATAHGSSA